MGIEAAIASNHTRKTHMKLTTNKSNSSGEKVDFSVYKSDLNGIETGTIITPDHTLKFSERHDIQLDETVIDVTYDGADFCMVFDWGKEFCATGSCASMYMVDECKFKAIVKLAYNLI